MSSLGSAWRSRTSSGIANAERSARSNRRCWPELERPPLRPAAAAPSLPPPAAAASLRVAPRTVVAAATAAADDGRSGGAADELAPEDGTIVIEW